jgi:hypothetical protein
MRAQSDPSSKYRTCCKYVKTGFEYVLWYTDIDYGLEIMRGPEHPRDNCALPHLIAVVK